jgi:hypothetical protein
MAAAPPAMKSAMPSAETAAGSDMGACVLSECRGAGYQRYARAQRQRQ